MPSTYSSNLKIELMSTGENSGTWGNITNTNLGTALEQAVVGYGAVSYASDANLTISITNSNAAQAARALVLNVTSSLSLTGTRELVVPTIEKQYIVQNNTTGSQSITVKTSAGTGITVPNGRKAHLYVDGTNVIQMFDFVDINGGTIDGTPIGGSSAAAGAFTTLNASGATTLDGNVALGNASGDLITVPGTINSHLLFTDNTYDIGANGATRPRNLFLAGNATVGGNLSVGGTLTLTGGVNLNGNVTVGDNASDTLTINATITSNLLFTDNTYDIGASGATRPRNLFLAGNATVGGNQTLTGSLTVDSTTDSSSTTTGSIQTDGGLGVAKAAFIGTNLNVAGNTTLGDAAADTLTVNSTITSNLIFTDNTYDIGASGATRPRNLFLGNNLAVGGNETITGYLGVGAAASSSNGINIASTNLAGAYQVGLQTALVGTSAATAGVFGIYTYPATAAAAFTTASVVGLYAENAVKGAGSTITSQYGVYITDQTRGANNFGLYSGVTAGTNKFNLYVGGSAANYLEGALTVNSGSSVFNESGGDNDFRVESDLNTHMLFVDGGNDAVGIGMVPLTTFGNRNSLEIGGNTVANLSLQAAIAETLYNFYINGSGQSVYSTNGPAGFQSFNNAVSAGWSFQTYPSGTAGGLAPAGTDLLALSPNGTIFNEGGADIDFRVESDTGTHAFFVDAGANAIGINDSSPTALLQLGMNGTANIANNVQTKVTNFAASNRFGTTGLTNNNDGIFFGMGVENGIPAGLGFMREASGWNTQIRFYTNNITSGPDSTEAMQEKMRIESSAIVINETGADQDFRVESDAATHMLFVDAGDNSVNINTNSPLGGTLNVNGTIYGNENHKVHYPLPYFNFGAGGINDEYWVLARRYVGTSILASGLMGRIVGSRGSTSSGNIAGYQNIIVQSAYLSNEGPLIDSQGPTPNFEAIDIISISGVEYYAARGRASGGPCDNGMWFEGMMVNNTGDSNVFSYTRASSAGVSVVTTNVATLNTWADRDTYLQAQRAGYDRQTINGTETNFNDPGLDYDFRVESDTNTHALFVDAGNASTQIADQVVFAASDAIGSPIGIVWAKPIGVNYTSSNGPTSYTIRLSCASVAEYFAIIRVVGLDPYADTGYYRYEAQVVGYLSSGIGTVISTNETPNQNPTFATPTFAANQVNIAVTGAGTNYRFQVTAEIYPRGAAATTKNFLLSIV